MGHALMLIIIVTLNEVLMISLHECVHYCTPSPRQRYKKYVTFHKKYTACFIDFLLIYREHTHTLDTMLLLITLLFISVSDVTARGTIKVTLGLIYQCYLCKSN